jgi:uncharacterized membrane protein YqjE
MDENATARSGLLETLHRLGATVLAILQNRLELLAVELQEERLRLFNALLLAAAIVALGFLTLVLAAFALAVVAWTEYGVLGLAGLCGLSLIGTFLAYWRLRIGLRNWPFLPNTLAELRKDRAFGSTIKDDRAFQQPKRSPYHHPFAPRPGVFADQPGPVQQVIQIAVNDVPTR